MSTRLNKGFLTHTITNLHCFFKFPQTGRSRGFGFVYYESSDDAREVGYLTVTISLKSQRDSCNMITFLTVQLITESCFFFQLNCNLFSVVVVHEGSYGCAHFFCTHRQSSVPTVQKLTVGAFVSTTPLLKEPTHPLQEFIWGKQHSESNLFIFHQFHSEANL